MKYMYVTARLQHLHFHVLSVQVQTTHLVGHQWTLPRIWATPSQGCLMALTQTFCPMMRPSRQTWGPWTLTDCRCWQTPTWWPTPPPRTRSNWIGYKLWQGTHSLCGPLQTCGGTRSHSYWTDHGAVGQGHILTGPVKVWGKVMFYRSGHGAVGQGRVLMRQFSVCWGEVVFLRHGWRCGWARSCSYGMVQGVMGQGRVLMGLFQVQGHVLMGLFEVWWGKVMFLRNCSWCGGTRSCSYRAVQGVVGCFTMLDREATMAAPGGHSSRQFF